MPYSCDNCGEIGARMNPIFEIRLCKNCLGSNQYRLICKSKAISKYFLHKNDIKSDFDYPKEYLVFNPYYRTAPPMTLYFEKEIQQIFSHKYYDLINYILVITNPLDDIENTLSLVKNYKKNPKTI